jgi:hypothetical protein
VSKVKQLTKSYGTHISIPWRSEAAAPQRVIFCVYHEREERHLRAKLDEFEILEMKIGLENI